MKKEINIEKIVIEGFGSFVEEFKFELDRGGVNIVRGENGAGKTTLFSAMVWGLFQINLKGSLNDAVVSWKNSRTGVFNGTRVIVYLKVDGQRYAVARHLKFAGNTFGVPGESDLLVFKENEDGEFSKGCLVSEVRGKSDTQAYVDKLLGVDSRTFLNSVMYAQRSKRFVEAEASEKRKLLEELFDLDFVDEMKKVAESNMARLAVKINERVNSAFVVGARSDVMRQRIEDAKESVRRWEKARKEKLEEIDDELKSLQREHREEEAKVKAASKVLAEFGDDIPDEASMNKRMKDADARYRVALEKHSAGVQLMKGAESEIRKLGRDLEKKEKEIGRVLTVCPTCGSDLKKEKIDAVKSKLKGEAKRIKEAIAVQEVNRDSYKKKVEELSKEYDEAASEKEKEGVAVRDGLLRYTTAKANKENGDAAIERIRAEHNRLLSRREKAESDDGKPELDIASMQESIDSDSETLANLAKEGEILSAKYDRNKWWSTVGLGAKGLKSYVFSAMLEQLNGYVQKYVERMGLGVRFSVDLSKTSAPFVTDCLKDGVVVDYKDLSGGEKQRIDIAMLFGLHDFVSDSVRFNVLIMDEVFEGLDQAGMEQVFDMIRVKASLGVTVYVITHRSEIDTMNCRYIDVRKNGGKTVIRA